jgi:NAD(P)-dependent dehydrogenase (short-subunit alcohol dehydrogenase family)
LDNYKKGRMNMTVSERLSSLFSLEGKTVILTGAAGGIGGALAKGLAEAGAEMLLCDISEDGLNAMEAEIKAAGGKARSYRLDIAKLEDITTCVSHMIADVGPSSSTTCTQP